MRQKSNSTPASSETLVRNIRRATRKHHAAVEMPHGLLKNLHRVELVVLVEIVNPDRRPRQMNHCRIH